MAKTFSKAFAEARKRLGAGKTFTWNGKSYSTDRADSKPAVAKPKQRPAKMSAENTRPKARPGSGDTPPRVDSASPANQVAIPPGKPLKGVRASDKWAEVKRRAERFTKSK